jgi:hypothetical protein
MTTTTDTLAYDPEVRAAAAACRSCGTQGLAAVLDLGPHPLANRLRAEAELGEPEPRFPLDLAVCSDCSLVQITESVDPDVLFSDYPYFSSVIKSLVEHAKAIALRVVAERDLGPHSLAMEVASNDGYLLQHYRDAGVPVLGIDPARNIARVAEERGIPTRVAFFGKEVAEQLVAEGFQPDVVHANNVMAHVPGLNSFIAGMAVLIGEKGRLITESPYLKDLLDHVEFDTIYHEHLCYYSITALDRLFARHGLVIEDVEHVAIHGGTNRYTVGAATVTERGPRVLAALEAEQAWGVDDVATYTSFGERVRTLGADLNALLDELKAGGAKLAAYGASAKGATLLNTFAIGRERLDFMCDASPHKQGLYAPGSGLPIVSPEALLTERPDYVLLLAWNFAEEILAQQQAFRDQGGKFIVPVPAPKVV